MPSFACRDALPVMSSSAPLPNPPHPYPTPYPIPCSNLPQADLANALFMRPGAVVVELIGEAFAEMPSYAFRAYRYLAATALTHRRFVARESDAGCVASARAWCAGLNATAARVRLREEEGDKPCTPKDKLIDCALDVRWVEIVALMSHREAARENPFLLHHSEARGLGHMLTARLAAHAPAGGVRSTLAAAQGRRR